MRNNIVTMTDSYKFTHHKMYPEGTTHVYSYFESRNGAEFDETVFFGLQYILREYLEGVVVTKEKVDVAEKFAQAHFGNENIFNREGWDYIVENCGGKLPVRIKAVPEGTPVTVNNVLMTVENTDPNCFWLTNHLETMLTHVWYASTVATLSRDVKAMMLRTLEKTAEVNDGIAFMLHDFGFRGVSSVESAAMGGAAHLVNFMGTDTVVGIEAAMEYYDADVCAYSVPASEHSVMTSLGPDGEKDMFEKLVDAYPTGILSVVSDSYDIFAAVEQIVGKDLKDKILNRDGVFVVRPDSGDPVPTVMKILELLGEAFGYTTNAKGYKVLNPKVRVIWGDGLNPATIKEILMAAMIAEWSTENLVFGMGGGLLQKVNRDTQRFAFKCSAQTRDGVTVDIFKDPTDKTKASKRGKLALYKVNGEFKTVNKKMFNGDDLLQTVFENGEVKKTYTFDEVRKNAEL